MQFSDLSRAVEKQFKAMARTGLFRAQVSKDDLWERYLSSFPEGSNPMFRERTEHDCQCCKSFIRAVGNAVAIQDGKLVTIWDVQVGGFYQVVADAMAALVKSAAIDNIFLHIERTAGVAKNFQQLLSGEVLTWNHFFLELPSEVVVPGVDIGTKLSETRSTHDVMLRGLKEITLDAIDTTLELIAQNSIYRGEEQKFAVTEFRKLKVKFEELPGSPARRDQAADLFVWANYKALPQSVSRIRNTALGTLLVDLSEGTELEDAVKAFERIMAPANYKRPTALVTKAMIEKARTTIEDLGYTSALERRYATIEDITINNILFADRTAKKAMNVFDEMVAAAPTKIKNLDKVEEISIEKFLSDILPKAESLEVMFENKHAGNLVSLIAPVHSSSKTMFKWPNNFSWSYTGEMADSIKERVKKAGGSVTGDLCCRLAWEYTDDLDFHMEEPNGFEIDFRTRRQLSPSGGNLDVDANGADGMVAHPVENIFYGTKRNMRTGVYILKVHNYNRRSSGVGFEIEVEFDGKIHHMVYEKVVPTGHTVEVARIQYTRDGQFEILSSLPSTQASKTLWSVPTQTFQKVNVVMHSPNYWDDFWAGGNKHYFFMLEGCLNDGKARGFFNEFLKPELDVHRKVFEMVGTKMKTEESDRQLSGLGFSSTQRNSLLCRVKGSFNRVVKINF
jgi:hypothetical protein